MHSASGFREGCLCRVTYLLRSTMYKLASSRGDKAWPECKQHGQGGIKGRLVTTNRPQPPPLTGCRDVKAPSTSFRPARLLHGRHGSVFRERKENPRRHRPVLVGKYASRDRLFHIFLHDLFLRDINVESTGLFKRA